MLQYTRVLRAAKRVSPALSAHGPGRPPPRRDLSQPARAECEAEAPRQKMPSGQGRDAVPPVVEKDTSGAGPSSRPLGKKSAEPGPSKDGRTSLPPRPASLVHAALRSRNPPEPAELLSVLKDKPHLLSRPSVTALDTYARRTNDQRVRRNLRALLQSERVTYRPEVEEKSRKKWPLRDPQAKLAWEDSKYSFDRWRPYHDTRVIPNRAFYKRYHPLPTLPEEVSPAQFIRHQHHLHLKREPYVLSTAIEVVISLGGDATPILDLALAYTTEPPHTILDDPAVKRVKKTRQTLHLAVLALLRQHLPLPSYMKPTPRPEPATKADIIALIKRWRMVDRKHQRTPGPETYRHIALHAIDQNDEELARYAFEGARRELQYEYKRAMWERHQSPYNAAPRAQLPDPSSDTVGEPSLEDVSPVTRGRYYAQPKEAAPSDKVEDAVPRFAHLGRRAARWERMLHALSRKGWVERLPEVEGLLIDKWRWRDEVAEAEEAENSDMEKENEKAAEKTTGTVEATTQLKTKS